jgi:aspartate aminotransferase
VTKLALAQRVAALAPSPTMALDAKTKALISQGLDVVNLTAGEPDFDTPAHIRQAAQEAMNRGETRYTPVGGTPRLKAAICDRMRAEIGIEYRPEEVLVSVGAKHSLFNAMMALISPGDGVLLPVPYWVTYPEQIRLAGGTVQFVPIAPEHQNVLTADDLRRVLTPETRGLILNSPSNPSGAVIGRAQLQEIAALAVERDLWVISDEIYAGLVYDGIDAPSIAQFEGMRDRTIVVNGVSKAYAMTGWRIGYALGPQHVIQAMANLQSQSTSNPTSVAQAAAEAALTGPQEPVDEMRREFDRRRRYAVSRIQSIAGLEVHEPKGAFYLWVSMAALVGRTLRGRTIRNADDLALAWLEEANVSVVPGSGFGVPDHFRMSYATSLERLEVGLDRMEALLGE